MTITLLIIKIFILILLIVFLFVSIKIFFVFLIGIKKNHILNKSVYKNVFKGKLSLIIILIFYGISFGLVGGTSLMTTNSKRSILKQYSENNLYQYETTNKMFCFNDDIANLEIEYWNKMQTDSGKKISIDDIHLINSIIPKILVESDKDREYFTPERIDKYNEIIDQSGNQVNLNELFSNEVFDYKNNNGFKDYMGWTGVDINDAMYGYLSYYIEKNWKNDFLYKGYENIDLFISDVRNKLFNKKEYFKDVLDFMISRDFFKKLNVSYKAIGYFNVTPKFSLDNGIDFEIVVLNDIDWKTGESLAKNNSNDLFQLTETNNNLPINNTKYIEGINLSNKENGFRKESNLFNDTLESNLQNYNVNVQEDYLKANNLNINDEIKFSPTTSFTIANSVRFSEVTYPTMGVNVLPNEKKQTFIQMNLSDFLRFSQRNSYDSIYNRKISYFIGENNLYKDLTSIDKWLSIRPPNYDDQIQKINQDYKQYDLNDEEIQKLINRYEEKQINNKNIQKWVDSTKLKINQDKYNQHYQGTSFSSDNLKSISSLSTVQSLRALMGSIESRGTESLLVLISGIFMVIVLIVISMLISKRINSLGKQLGTLKAMGMNNKNISSSYIIFPLVIIGLGFVISSLVSPLVMMILKGIMAKYYYISFSSLPLSFKYFLLLLIIPLILSISISYFISLKTLRKPTLDLLANKGKDAPNILVRAFGYITPKKLSFSFSYMSKGLLRAIGKSSLLFVSILFSTMLVSFAMSSTTMIKHQTENALKYLNFDSVEVTKNNNNGQFNVQKMYEYDEDGKLQLIYKDKLIKYSEESHKEILSKIKNFNTLDLKNTENFSLKDFNSIYDSISNLVMKPINESMDKNIFLIENWKVNDSKKNYLIDKDVMSTIFFSESILKFTYNKISNGDLSFYEWEENKINDSSRATYSKMSWITKNWLTVLAANFIKNNETLKIPDLSNMDIENFIDELNIFLKNVYNYSSDVSFGTIYYNQFNQTITDFIDIEPMQQAINDESYFKFKELKQKNELPDYLPINLNISPDEESFKNLLGSNTKISNDLWNLFDPYISNGNTLKTNFIPIIATTQSIISLDKMVQNGLVNKHNHNIYTVSIPFDIYKNDCKNNDKALERIYLKVDIKIVGSLFMGADFGSFTTQEFIESYLENYNYKEIKGQFIQNNDTNNFQVYDKNENYEYDIVNNGENYNGAFNINQNNLYNIKNSKNFPPNSSITDDNDGKRNAPLAISTNNSLFHYLINNISFSTNFTLKQLLSNINENIGEVGKLSNNLYLNNGFPLKVDKLLEQASKAYEMIITLFVVISFFAIFMATTIILISIKDIIDASKREISMLKAFGYSNTKATSLLIIPYLFIILLAFVLAIPLTFVSLSIIASALTIMTGNLFVFTLTLTQIALLISFIFGFSGLLMLMAYISFKNTNALDAIRQTDE